MPLSDRELAVERQKIKKQLGTAGSPEAGTQRRGTDNQASEFDHAADIYFGNCDICIGRVGYHCPRCKVKVTGCSCTLMDRFDDIKEQAAEKRNGLWTPDA